MSTFNAFIQPLQIRKKNGQDQAYKGLHPVTEEYSTRQQYLQIGEMTPPLTPAASNEDLHPTVMAQSLHFYDYLRATYPFHPPCDFDPSTVTLPLNRGDIILIHSVHSNGWADGTLLDSGCRGWLPTNYCLPFDPEPIRNLMKGATTLWDAIKDFCDSTSSVPNMQDLMRGVVAGVRYLLVKTKCLNREELLISASSGYPSLQRHRKALLSDLSGLVKLSKDFEAKANGAHPQSVDEADCSQIVLAAFKLVTRAVRLHDVWLQVPSNHQGTPKSKAPAVTPNDMEIPPTPPADSGYFDSSEQNSHKIDSSLEQQTPVDHMPSDLFVVQKENLPQQSNEARPDEPEQKPSHHSVFPSPLSGSQLKQSSEQVKRQSASHRMSWLTKPTSIRNDKLASERLVAANELFLSYLGMFLGIHLITRTSTEILVNTKQSVNAGRSLLTVVEAVWDRDLYRSKRLKETRDAMYMRITELVDAARPIFQPSEDVGKEEFDPVSRKGLADAAMSCVKAAGDCVDSTRSVLELIGNFEFETIDGQSAFSGVDFESSQQFPNNATEENSALVNRFPMPPSPSQNSQLDSPAILESKFDVRHNDVNSSLHRLSSTSLLPPPPSLTDSISSLGDSSPLSPTSNTSSQGYRNDALPPRKDSVGTSNTLSGSTFASGLPDMGSALSKESAHRSDLTLTGLNGILPTASSQTDSPPTDEQELEEVEANIMRKTFAHELTFNKEGQITGGTLAALIERLTDSDATPDADFVFAFYLTFRHFSSPQEVASALIERFKYCSQDKMASGPVTLRVYNVFKGWLESHWRHESDNVVLPLIESFAHGDLLPSLPSAAQRLMQLTKKILEAQSTLVPRHTMSAGKVNSSKQYNTPDSLAPVSVVSKSQLGLLRLWRSGGNSPTILDFEPLELARQITVKTSNIFCSILPEELLNAEWTKKSGSIAHNVRAITTLATDITNLVTDTILQFDEHNKRAKIIKQWVKIASKCLELNNYDSLIAIVASLNSTPIARLKRTWDCVSSKTKALLEQLNSITDFSKNYSTLRQRLSSLLPPCLPFIGTYLTDLTFMDVGNSSTRKLSNPKQERPITVINFDKHLRTAKMILDIQRFQVPHNLQEVSELQAWIQEQLIRVRSSVDSGDSPVNKMYRRSCVLEPREQMVQRPAPLAAASTSSSIPRLQKREGEFMGLSWR